MKRNPFVLSPSIPDELFCDRLNESQSLIRSITNQENVVLTSPRRVGKTGLIYHCFNQESIKEPREPPSAMPPNTARSRPSPPRIISSPSRSNRRECSWQRASCVRYSRFSRATRRRSTWSAPQIIHYRDY